MMNPVNRVYTLLNPPAWIPVLQELQDFVRVLLYLHELSDLTVGIAESREAVHVASLRAAPRPCRGVLQVGLPTGLGGRDLLVRDICGRLVKREVVPAGSKSAAMDLSGLQPGVYYVSASGAGTVPVVVVR